MTTGLSLAERFARAGVLELAQQVAVAHRLPLDALACRDRTRPRPAARAALCRALRASPYGWSLPRIGALLGMHHCSVLYLVEDDEWRAHKNLRAAQRSESSR